jgi:hypothetical protein
MMKTETGQASASIAKVHSTLVRYERYNELHELIDECREISKMAGEPQCMTLEGVTGAGKSTLLREYAKAFPRYEMEEGSKIPVFYARTPSPVTVKGMASRMLEELGDPAAGKGTLWSMNSRLRHFFKECEVEIAFLDDLHQLIDRKTYRILEEVSDWLKVLIKDTNIPFVVVGITGTMELILETNPQLSRLFAARETLAPLHWDPKDSKAMEEFVAFVTFAEAGMEISLSQEIERKEMLHRLYHATDGVVGNVMNLMRAAVLRARKEGAQELTLSILSEAFEKRLRKHMGGRANPFETDPTKTFAPSPSRSVADPPNSTNNRSWRRTERQLKVAQVLTAA